MSMQALSENQMRIEGRLKSLVRVLLGMSGIWTYFFDLDRDEPRLLPTVFHVPKPEDPDVGVQFRGLHLGRTSVD